MVLDRDQSMFPAVLQSKMRHDSDGYRSRGCSMAGFLFSSGGVCSFMSQKQLGALH